MKKQKVLFNRNPIGGFANCKGTEMVTWATVCVLMKYCRGPKFDDDVLLDGPGYPRHRALCRAAEAWEAAKRVCTYCGTWKRIYGNWFRGEYFNFPLLLAAMNGELFATARLWQRGQTVDLEQLPPQQRWLLFDQLPVECEHFDRACERCHGRLCTHHLHALCTRGTCSLCHCTQAVWVTQWVAGPYGMMQQQVAVTLPA
jgi:hypothetical protein